MLGLYVYEAGQLPLIEDDKNRGHQQQDDAQEVLNYVTALHFDLDALIQKPLSLNLLRDLHAILMQDVRGGKATLGEFRRIQNYIGSSAGKLEIARYVPPPVRELAPLLDAFEKYIHTPSEEDPLIRMAWLHYQFEAIHPFLDGNGRIGRLLIALLLVEWNLLPAPLLYLSAFFERHRSTYYDLLLAVSQKSAWRDWTLFFLQGVSAQALEAASAAKRLQDIERDWRQRVQSETTVRITPRVVEMLFESPILSARIIQERLGVSQPTANAAINELERMGILKPVRSTMRPGWYVAQNLLPQDI
jgi:Fic family protein